uniref:Uncharacterized protein n=1 Tax=Molossus molossus TaxID=27622 RepID=A0A7J8DQ19_MOLMO|nr:hypothetical protein HJG59_009238 [Molossus molossus]
MNPALQPRVPPVSYWTTELGPRLSTRCSTGTRATLASIKAFFQENGQPMPCGSSFVFGYQVIPKTHLLFDPQERDCQREGRKSIGLKSAVLKDLHETKEEAARAAARVCRADPAWLLARPCILGVPNSDCVTQFGMTAKATVPCSWAVGKIKRDNSLEALNIQLGIG